MSKKHNGKSTSVRIDNDALDCLRHLAHSGQTISGVVVELLEENSRLLAEVERLRKEASDGSPA